MCVSLWREKKESTVSYPCRVLLECTGTGTGIGIRILLLLLLFGAKRKKKNKTHETRKKRLLCHKKGALFFSRAVAGLSRKTPAPLGGEARGRTKQLRKKSVAARFQSNNIRVELLRPSTGVFDKLLWKASTNGVTGAVGIGYRLDFSFFFTNLIFVPCGYVVVPRLLKCRLVCCICKLSPSWPVKNGSC